MQLLSKGVCRLPDYATDAQDRISQDIVPKHVFTRLLILWISCWLSLALHVMVF